MDERFRNELKVSLYQRGGGGDDDDNYNNNNSDNDDGRQNLLFANGDICGDDYSVYVEMDQDIVDAQGVVADVHVNDDDGYNEYQNLHHGISWSSAADMLAHKYDGVECDSEYDEEQSWQDYGSTKEEFDYHKVDADRDWNGEYQEIYDRNVATPQDERIRADDLSELREAFREHYTAIAKAIVLSRVYCDSREPLVVCKEDVGGRAGGEKFVVGKVLYKFATDVFQIYGGNDQEATKAAALELKATNALVDASMRLIHTTLVGLFRYRGHCVYAIALAPIKRLVYGSGDAGRTHVLDAHDMPAIATMMDELARTFHLRSHGVLERSTNIVKHLCHPVDIECHVGKDDRVYVFDLAREAPPTPPVKRIPHSFLTRHFRFEFLRVARQCGLPSLSSDAFSKFSVPEDRIKDTNDTKRVFEYLIFEVIPKLSAELDTNDAAVRGGAVELSSVFHKHGVNMRYLPSVAKHCKVPSMRLYLCEEMYVRTLKVYVRALWNRLIESSEWMLLERLKVLVAELWGEWSSKAWPQQFVRDLHVKYCDIPQDLQLIDEDLQRVSRVGGHSWLMVLRVLDSLCVEYDTSLSLASIDDLNVHRVSWQMRPDVATLKAPEFVALHDREKQLYNEVSLRESSGISILTPLVSLLSLYQKWSEEETSVTKEHGVAVCERVLSIVDSSVASTEMAWALYEVSEFFKHFAFVDRSLRETERSVAMFRELLERCTNDNTMEPSEQERRCNMLKSGLSVLLNSMGIAYRSIARFAEAQQQYEESLELCHAVSDPDSIDEALTIMNLANLLQQKCEYSKCLELYERSKSILVERCGEHDPRVADVFMNMGIAVKNTGDYGKALRYFDKSLVITKETQGENHPDVANTLMNMAIVFKRQGKYTKALEYYQNSLAICKESVGEDHPHVADILMNMGIVYKHQERLDKALECYERSLEISETKLGRDHPDVSDALMNMAIIYKRKCEYATALRLYERSLSITERTLGKDHPDAGDVLMNMAIVYKAEKKYDKALTFFEKSLAITEKALGPNHADVANTTYNIGTLYESLKDFSTSLEYYYRSLAINRQVLGDVHVDVADTLLAVGYVYKKQRKYEEALKVYNEALGIYEELEDSPNTDDLLNLLQDLAVVHKKLGNRNQAISYYNRSLQFFERDDEDLADTLNNLANLHMAQNQYAEAEGFYKRSIDITRSLDENHADTADTMFNLGGLYERQGRNFKALECFRESKRIWTVSLPANHSDLQDVERAIRRVQPSQ